MDTNKVSVFEDGKDSGYLGNRQNWWFDPTFPHSFTIFDLDAFYEGPYFATDHVGPAEVGACVDLVLAWGKSILGQAVTSVLELGCGGGWFTVEFLARGLDVVAVEGSATGFRRTIDRGVPPGRVIRHDLRLPLQLKRPFDVVVCTEVAEHVEPPFSSQLVRTIVDHGKLAWFSFEEPGTNEAHYHHCNEQPEVFWRNLFRFFGYRMLRVPAETKQTAAGRSGYVFYANEIPLPAELLVYQAHDEPVAGQSLGDINSTLRALAEKAPLFVPDHERAIDLLRRAWRHHQAGDVAAGSLAIVEAQATLIKLRARAKREESALGEMAAPYLKNYGQAYRWLAEVIARKDTTPLAVVIDLLVAMRRILPG